MKITNRANLPDSLVRAVENDPYVGGGDISATQLILPPQIRVLRKLHDDVLEEDVTQRIWSLLGQAIHTILERAGELGLREKRLYMPVHDWILSGQFDRLVFTPQGVLQDYKVTSTWVTHYPKAEWEAQMNILAALCRYNGYDIERLEAIAIFRDWQYQKAQHTRDYPADPAAAIPITLWSPIMADRYIQTRVALHRRAEVEGKIDPCTDEERWYRGEEWAVIKAGRISALRVLSTENEAMDWAANNGYTNADGLVKGVTILRRPGHYVRCERYCPVSTVCPQWARDRLSEA